MGTCETRAIIPDMLIKLKQGFGRLVLIRKMSDTGVVVMLFFLGIRVSQQEVHMKGVLSSLPFRTVTSSIAKLLISYVSKFFRAKKSSKYFE